MLNDTDKCAKFRINMFQKSTKLNVCETFNFLRKLQSFFTKKLNETFRSKQLQRHTVIENRDKTAYSRIQKSFY